MDNISHSLVGLALGELADRSLAPEPDPARARVRHRLLLVCCWAASNFPDLDLLLTRLGPRPLGYLLHHRGFTHTLVGLLPQALLLLALVWLLWPAARALLRDSRPARAAAVAVTAAGLLLHLAMDYLNVYGVHPFYPFDARWVYGDLVFIVGPVFWVAFGAPLAMLVAPGMPRRVGLALLVGVPVLFTALGFLTWGSLAALAVLGVALAWLQQHAGERGRAALGCAFAAGALFVAGQEVARDSVRALVDAQPRNGRLLDAALSAFPANPVCWSIATVELDEGVNTLVVRRALASLAPALMPAAACPAGIAGTLTADDRQHSTGPLAWQWEQEMPVRMLRGLRRTDCALDAWLRFARTPILVDGKATDVRFGPPGAANFTTMGYGAGAACPYPVPRWGYPRADILGAG